MTSSKQVVDETREDADAYFLYIVDDSNTKKRVCRENAATSSLKKSKIQDPNLF